ncbi:MAG: S8 family serine peptidase [Actinomycetia bacterium]|nr:S8 family serine peptidase [Actinomycetes bacterium]
MTRNHQQTTGHGTVWEQARSLRYRVAAATLVALGIASLAAPAAVTPVESEAVPTLGTSMVEMLATNDSTAPVRLSKVRSAVEATLDDPSMTGAGIDVALIDTGVSPVAGLDGADKVVHGPDLSFEGTTPEVAYLDTYGHGTHMAGIIAGTRASDKGIAPGARIVSIKTTGHDGMTTVPQVVAAIDWVIEHRNVDGLNIRVLNLSLGQEGVNDHVGDYLSAAVERAWEAEIFVVVAAGNDGDTQNHLDSPAVDPYVLAVGAQDYAAGKVSTWSATGDGDRNPDLITVGRSIASYRVPGSTIDAAAPSARYRADLFLGSGTSQAAAVVTGVAALILEAQPELTPDELKATMTRNAIDSSDPSAKEGNGRLSGNKAEKELNISSATQNHSAAAGEASGITTPNGATWSGGTWSGATWSGATWSGATWSGATWSGATWSGATWSGATWSGNGWS